MGRLLEGMKPPKSWELHQSEEVLLWNSLRSRKMSTPLLDLEDKQLPLDDAAREVLFLGMGNHVPHDCSQMTTALGLDTLIGQQV